MSGGSTTRAWVQALAVPVAIAAVLVLAFLAVTGMFTHHHNTPSATPPPTTSAITSINPGRDATDTQQPPSSPHTTTPHVPASPHRFPAPFTNVNPADPSAVMKAALTTIFSYRPATDSSQMDAATRAKPLLGPAGVDAGFAALAPITGHQWQEWKEQKLVVTAVPKIPSRGDNPDTATTVSRVATITQTVTNPSTHQPAGRPPSPLTAFVTCRKDATGAWHITTISVQS